MTIELALSLLLALVGFGALLHRARERARLHPLARLNADMQQARERRRGR